MKVIVANYRYFIAGGPEKYMFKLIEASKNYDIEIIPFSIQNDQNEYSEYSDYFAKPRSKQLMYKDTKKTLSNLYGMFRSTVWNYDAESRLRKLIKKTNPDVVYILHEINHLSPSIIRAANKEGVRVVHRISDFFMFCPKYDFLCNNEICEACLHGDYKKALKNKCVKNSFPGTLLRVLSMKLYWKINIFDMVDQYVCTCNFTKRKLIEGGIPEDKIKCINTFIETSSITPVYKNKRYFLFLGRLAHQKGAIYAIEAMNYLKNTGYILKITGNLGETSDDIKIREFIEKNNLQEVIQFVGFKKGIELDELIDNSTCILCPSIWYENMPNTVIEAYAHGKPVIASKIGSLEEIVIDNKTGFLFDPKNSLDLAEKMKRYIENEELCIQHGIYSRKVCEELYNKNKHMVELINVLKGENNE